MKITASINQSLIDVALQWCGSIEALYDLALNNALSASDAVAVGQKLITPQTQNEVARWMAANREAPTTAVLDASPNEGIDYWAIEVDFVIQ